MLAAVRGLLNVSFELTAWGCGASVIGSDLAFSVASGALVVELGRSSVGRSRQCAGWIHAVDGSLPLASSLAIHNLCVCKAAVVPYVFDNEVDYFNDLRVDVRWSYDPSAHLVHGEPILPTAFHLSFLCERFKPLCLTSIEIPSFLVVSCAGGAYVSYQQVDGSLIECLNERGGVLFRANRLNDSSGNDPSPPPGWLLDAARRAELKPANFHHPFVRWAGEFLWRSREAYGHNWSTAELVSPGKNCGGIGLIDSVLQQCVFTMANHHNTRFKSFRKIVIKPDAFAQTK